MAGVHGSKLGAARSSISPPPFSIHLLASSALLPAFCGPSAQGIGAVSDFHGPIRSGRRAYGTLSLNFDGLMRDKLTSKMRSAGTR